MPFLSGLWLDFRAELGRALVTVPLFIYEFERFVLVLFAAVVAK